MLVSQPLAPAVIVVDGACTLPDAITAANTGSATGSCSAGDFGLPNTIQLTVDVTLTTVDSTADGPNGLPSVTSEIVVEGNDGVADHAVSRSSGDPFRVFHVGDGGSLTLNDLTVSGGKERLGGGIFNRGSLVLTHSTVSGNTATDDDYVKGGGIYNLGSATITGSTISGNTAQGVGGLEGYNDARGGGIFTSGPLVLSYSTVSGNSVSATFGAYGGGIRTANAGDVTITNSTISSNDARGVPGYFSSVSGGGVEASFTTNLRLYNTTFANNTIDNPFEGFDAGAAIYNNFDSSSVVSYGSVFGFSTGANCGGMIVDSGGSLADDDTCGMIPATLSGLDPILADNGGPTRTHALMTGSSAIDNAGVCGLASDQRGVPRDDGLCDSGSFELAACTAPDGDTLLLELDTVEDVQLFEVCTTITAQNDYVVMGPGGDLTLRAGSGVILGDGFSVTTDGVLTVDIDPTLQMPDSR